MKEITVRRQDAGQSLKKYCFKFLNAAPQSFTYRMLRKKNILLNEKKAAGEEVLKEGDRVRFYLSEETISKFAPEREEPSGAPKEKKNSLTLTKEMVIYEDPDILIVSKPAGLLSQKATKDDYSVNEAVRDYLLRKEGSLDTVFRPSAVNRLDRNTSGILLVGLTVKGADILSQALREKSIRKIYLAIVKGCCRLTGTFTAYLTKDEKKNRVILSEKGPGQEIQNRFRPLYYEQEKDVTVMEVELLTGKSHQIRAHLSFSGYPIAGDVKYGGKVPFARRQLLHAYSLTFPEKDSLGKLSGKTITAPLPEDMNWINLR